MSVNRTEARLLALVPRRGRSFVSGEGSRRGAEEGEERGFGLGTLCGRLSELRGEAAMTLGVGLALEAQRAGEPVAWLMDERSSFFPPDVADSGVDLDALLVVRAKDVAAAVRAADQLARSGAFGLLVVDAGRAAVPAPLLTRLLGLSQKHATAVVFLTEQPDEAPSLGPLVSLRGTARRRACAEGHSCDLTIVKDKLRAPGWTFSEVCRGPDGLR